MHCLLSIGRRCLSSRALRCAVAVSIGVTVGVYAGSIVLSRLPGPISVVQGSSMMPTFEPGARIYVSRINRPLQRGDIVLLNDGKSGRAIKRVVGLPGEKVRLWRGYVFIDNKLLREPYLPKYTFTHPDLVVKRDAFALGCGNYFVMGDNRETSYDSRNYGPVCLGEIVALVPQAGAVPPECTAYALPVHGRELIKNTEGQERLEQ